MPEEKLIKLLKEDPERGMRKLVSRYGGIVEGIVDAEFYPLVNAWSYEIACSVSRFAFDSSGKLLSSENTGKISVVYK